MTRRLLATIALAWVLGFGWFMLTLPGPAAATRTDAIVVLTGGPGRIDRALALLHAGKARRLLVTGVGRGVRAVDLAREYHTDLALFRCCIDLGLEAVDTRSNAEETHAWISAHRYRTVRLVTSDWHLRRAELELRTILGPGVTVIGDGVHGDPSPAVLFAEYNKLLVRWAAVRLGIA